MAEDERCRAGGSSSSTAMVRAPEDNAQRFSALQPQLLCAAVHFFHRHIRSDSDVLQRMEGNQMFRLFFEVPYHNKPDLNRIFPDSVHDCSALHVCSFILSILHQGIFSVSAFIVSVIYLSRFKESSRITLHACTWRPLFLTSLLLADKMWEDKPVRNSSLAKLFPVLNNAELNRMESEFLDEIKFNVLVKPDLFCSFCEKLLAEQVHQEISRCVSQSEYAVTLQSEVNLDPPMVPAKPANGKSSSQEAVSHPLDAGFHTNGSSKGGSLGSHRQKTVAEMAAAAPSLHQPEAVARTSLHGRHGQVPVAWMEATGPSSASAAPATVPAPCDGLSSAASAQGRSQSAGPTAHCGSRRCGDGSSQALTTQQIHPVLAQQLWAASGGGGASGGAVATGQKSGTQPPPGRSISVHPLHRNDSTKKHACGQVEDGPENSAVQRGHAGVAVTVAPGPGAAAAALGGQQVLRRSLPAKTSAPGYIPLPRAPSAGASVVGGAPPPASGVPTPGSSEAPAASQGPPSHRSTHPCGSSLAVAAAQAAAAAAASGGPQRPAQQSPRSPVPIHQGLMTSDHLQNHQSLRAVSQVQQMQTQARQLHSQGSSQRSSTPPALAIGSSGQVLSSMAKGHPTRGSSPAGGYVSSSSQAQQPTRASSAPRVAGVGVQQQQVVSNSSNVRASSQPMQVVGSTSNVRASSQPMTAHYQPGSPQAPASGQQLVQGGIQAGSYGQQQQVVFAGNQNMRGASPAPGITVAGGMPMAVTRGTITGQHHRNASPAGLAAPNSPAGALCMGQVLSGGTVTSQRGRSPAPSQLVGGGAGAAGGAQAVQRAPRAVTPNSLVKGITQGIHAGGVVQRSSLRAGHTVHRQGLM